MKRDQIARRQKPGRRAFTLVELLTVMTIILLLAGMLLPAVLGIVKRGDIALAKSDVRLIEAAVLNYLGDYGKFPNQSSGTGQYTYNQGSDYLMLMATLRGSNISGSASAFVGGGSGWPNQNPRGKVFLDISDKNIVTNTAVIASQVAAQFGELADPWGNRYQVVADWSMQGNLQADGDALQNRRVAVWSWGPSNTTANAMDPSHIRSWR